MYNAHRGIPGPPPRLNELLDQIRQEFDLEARKCLDYESQSEFVSRAFGPCRYPLRTHRLCLSVRSLDVIGYRRRGGFAKQLQPQCGKASLR
jgi:hypothetical protein